MDGLGKARLAEATNELGTPFLASFARSGRDAARSAGFDVGRNLMEHGGGVSAGAKR
jgi:hypothetical protein